MKIGRCGSCDAKDAELERARVREVELLAQLRDVTKMLSAHADTKAHLAATREKVEPGEHRQPSARIPAFVNTLHSGRGHLRLSDVKRRMAAGKPDRTKPPIAS